MATWLYFATTSQATEKDTHELAINGGCIWRSAYAHRQPPIAIPHVRSIFPGDRMILLYQERKRAGWKPQGIFRVLDPGPDRIENFPAIGRLPVEDWYLERLNYRRDPVLNSFVGFLVEVDAAEDDYLIFGSRGFARSGRNAIEPYQGLQRNLKAALSQLPHTTTVKRGPIISLDLKSAGGKRFLGIDVGFSEVYPSLGYCSLQVNEHGIEMECENSGVKLLTEFRDRTLPDLLCQRPYAAVALDGPLTPSFLETPRPWFRPQEKFLTVGEIPKRIRAQPYNSPVGWNLHKAAMELRFVCEQSGYKYESYSGIAPGTERLILEAFPKLWLALLLDPSSIDEKDLKTRQRSVIDHVMATRLFGGRRNGESSPTSGHTLEKMPLKGESIARFVEEDKDQACAFASAMAALLVFIGCGSVLGNENMGSFALPTSALWHPGWHDRMFCALHRFRPDEGGPLQFSQRD